MDIDDRRTVVTMLRLNLLSQMPPSKGQEAWESDWEEREKGASGGSQMALGVANCICEWFGAIMLEVYQLGLAPLRLEGQCSVLPQCKTSPHMWKIAPPFITIPERAW